MAFGLCLVSNCDILSAIKHRMCTISADVMLGIRLLRWASIKTTVGQRLVFVGMYLVFFAWDRLSSPFCHKLQPNRTA